MEPLNRRTAVNALLSGRTGSMGDLSKVARAMPVDLLSGNVVDENHLPRKFVRKSQ